MSPAQQLFHYSRAGPHSQEAWRSTPRMIPTAIKAQLQKDCAHSPTGVHLECPAQVTGEAESLGPTEHLLHMATLPIPGDKAALLNK